MNDTEDGTTNGLIPIRESLIGCRGTLRKSAQGLRLKS
nr:MAG TPA_asm: hypothetical protein [Caudoviricetes sp.]